GVELGCLAGVERRRRGLSGLPPPWRSAASLPAGGGDADAQPGGERAKRWHEVGGEPEPAGGGECEHTRAVLGDERCLDLLLGVASAHEAADQDPLALGLWCVRERERDAADQTHHLVLDVGLLVLGQPAARAAGAVAVNAQANARMARRRLTGAP